MKWCRQKYSLLHNVLYLCLVLFFQVSVMKQDIIKVKMLQRLTYETCRFDKNIDLCMHFWFRLTDLFKTLWSISNNSILLLRLHVLIFQICYYHCTLELKYLYIRKSRIPWSLGFYFINHDHFKISIICIYLYLKNIIIKVQLLALMNSWHNYMNSVYKMYIKL